MKAIRIFSFGGPEVLTYQDVPPPKPGPGEVVVKIEAAGVNFIDIYQRTGLYSNALPFTPGLEGSGTVLEVGPGTTEVGAGDRVAYAMSLGAYAEYAVVPAAKLVPLPASLTFVQGAAAMLQGITADFLTNGVYALKKGQTLLIHAAAGGVGLLFVQMAKRIGARVIGTVSTPEKEALAREAGADEIILYGKQDFVAEVKRLTQNHLCDVVYDSVGQETFEKSLSCLKRRGTLVLFGQSSAPVSPINPITLSAKGSLYLTRPSLGDYIATREELLARAGRVFDGLASGLKLRIHETIPLSEAARAQTLLENRRTTGKVVLLP